MRLYWEIARRGYRRYAAYPIATAAGVFTNTVFGFMRGYVLLAVFRLRDDVGGYDAADTLTYVWLTQALIMTIFLWGWFDLAERVRTGDIAVDLRRPVDFQLYGLAFDLGRALYHFVYRGIAPFLVGALAFDLRIPDDPLLWFAFAASVPLAVCVSYAYRFLYNLAAFWLLDYRGIVIVSMVFSLFFSGFIVPLAFFPEWLRAIAYALPFAAMIQVPIDVFLGKYGGADLVGMLAVQLGWAIALLLVGRTVLGVAMRKLVVQGG
jgi:ABC-2 type transport system permease protein